MERKGTGGMKFVTALLLFFTVWVCMPRTAGAQDSVYVPQSWQLEGDAEKAWDSIENIWHNAYLDSCLKTYGIRLRCSDCESVYLRAVFSIDSAGMLLPPLFKMKKMCGEEFDPGLENCMLEFFRKMVFPAALRGLRFEVLLGRGLKC